MSIPSVSVVVPTYNCAEKMEESLESLRSFSQAVSAEVIFVDDCSNDETHEVLTKAAAGHANWHVYQLPTNSGSAAAPRNYGLERATGEFVYFHDSDDVLIPDGMSDALQFGIANRSDCVRASLIVRHGNGVEKLAELIPRWDSIKNPLERVRALVRHQSLTCSFFIRRSILMDDAIRFDPSRRIGEDIVFAAQVIANSSKISYRSKPIRKYIRASVGEESVTQKITSNDFADFVRAWTEVEHILSRTGISFVQEHGFAAIQYALKQFIWFRVEELQQDHFYSFSTFVNEHWSNLKSFPFAERYREVIICARNGDREGFNRATRLRLVLAGHDLKFVKVFIGRFEDQFNIRYDEWSGHESHDVVHSESCVEWGDLFWVEWLLGAAVWYSHRISNLQRLIVRTHRSEYTVDYGLQINVDRVDAFVAIAPHTLGDFSDRFDIPRSKFWLIPNAYDMDSYTQGTGESRLRRIALVGSLPKLKGLHKALDVMIRLHEVDSSYSLTIFGKRASDLDWLMKIPEERRYFEGCEYLIEESKLKDSVQHGGWIDTRTELQHYGFVLSLSDYEGMQQSIGDGFSAGAVALTLSWRGAKECYPAEFIVDSEEEMVSEIIRLSRDSAQYNSAVNRGQLYMRRRYNIDVVWTEIANLIRSIRA